MRCVEYLWQQAHPGAEPPEEILNLGLRNYRPRHAMTASTRKRVYL